MRVTFRTACEACLPKGAALAWRQGPLGTDPVTDEPHPVPVCERCRGLIPPGDVRGLVAAVDS